MVCLMNIFVSGTLSIKFVSAKLYEFVEKFHFLRNLPVLFAKVTPFER